ncbi:MAG: YkgJ family cysteine cluster protein [Candidatus Hydrogenedentes bacterium]|nr:YkgJ family cysteine cluster protein [Candidatus Hydrogenedentota bacterium]
MRMFYVGRTQFPHKKTKNPCITCGACCAYYKVTFYWGEINEELPGGVPSSLCEKYNDYKVVMKGTNSSNPRCIALLGTIGKRVFCRIHHCKPSICKEIEPSFKNGEREIKCDKARLAYGLPPLTPHYWVPDNSSNIEAPDEHKHISA